jgi:hypothetical protein
MGIAGIGTYIDALDCNGQKIHIGDTLAFDPREWGGTCEFVIMIKKGQILHPGSTEDLTEWCKVVKKYDDTTQQ